MADAGSPVVVTLMGLMSFLLIPAVVLVLLAVILAAFGTSIGLRRFYVAVLLRIFEFGKQREDKFARDNEETSSDSDSDFDIREEKPFLSNGDRLIQRQTKTYTTIQNVRSLASMQNDFQLTDAMYFCRKGVEAIVEDEVTQRFSSSELSSWNLLTRTNTAYQHVSWRLTFLWIIGTFFRYVLLVPVRLCIVSIGFGLLVAGTAFVGYVPNGRLKYQLNKYFTIMSCRVITRAFGAVIRFHNTENRSKSGGICVANHTSPLDVIILQNDNCYAMIGQRHGGFLGIIQNALSRATDHIWFERSVARDRLAVGNRLRKHVADETKLPVLIFPEGTCINNTSVMMFKKGSFEVGGTIYPVAIKYDPRFSDCFWNSSQQSMVKHIFLLMSSWAIVCDVWYLPPEHQLEGESAVQYANRVKATIAQKGGLVDLEWDGGLKREKPKPSLKQLQQNIYSEQLKTE